MRLFPALLLLAGCSTFGPPDATQIDPPASWRTVWDSAQACSGLHGRFDDLRFYVVPKGEMPGVAGHTEGHDIYLREDWQESDFVVKHEMIHALGVHHHPYHPFVDPCHATWESMND